MSDYLALNRANWDQRAAVHAASQTYDLARYVADPTAISGVVRFDADRLGDLTGLDVVHLQCHIGTDTVSLARLGAATITGLDLSPRSLDVARQLAADCGIADATFVESDVYRAVEALGAERFDLVYTGVGALNWLPSIERWAQVVAGLLRPGGRLFVRDGHPMWFTIDYQRPDDLLVVHHPYFEQVEPFVDDEPGTYTDGDTSSLTATTTHEWSHGIGETVQAVLDAGLVLTGLAEHTEMEWPGLPQMVPTDGGRYALPANPARLPLMFTLEARKPE
jgi:SAM-dependent methyltransferase